MKKKALPPSLTIYGRLLCWFVLLDQSTPLSLRLKLIWFGHMVMIVIIVENNFVGIGLHRIWFMYN